MINLADSALDLLRTFSAIDAATPNVAGVNQMQDLVAARLVALVFTVTRTRGEARFGDLIVGERPGARWDEGWVTLVTHVDTVLGNERPFVVDERTGLARGAGVIDNKGGLAVGLRALTCHLAEAGATARSLRFVCSPNEEMGSVGFTEMFEGFAADTAVALGLEPALDDGSIIHQRRGNRWYDVVVKGREAHAGRSYGRHANAAHDLARKITRLAKLTKYRRHVSLSVGALSGGRDRHNVVCGEARAKLDARFASFEARDRLHRRITRILASPRDRATCGEYPTETSVEIVDDCPPFTFNARSKRLARAYRRIASEIEGRPVRSKIAGGAGDVNYFSRADNVVLDGLGPVGGEMHTGDEWLRVESLETRAKALSILLSLL